MTVGSLTTHQLRRHRRPLVTTTAALALVSLIAAGCSSSGNGSGGGGGDSSAAGGASTPAAPASSGGGGGSSCMTAADHYLKPWDSLPTKLSSAYTPLASKPTTGGTVIKLVNGSIPSDNESFEQQQIAAKAIGWTAKKIVFNGTVEDLNQKYEQAISEKPTAITTSGWPVAALSKPIADAKQAGIIVALSSVPDAAISNPGYAANTNGAATAKEIGTLNAYEFMRDSDCKGSAAIFNLPFPILKTSTDAFQATVKANCPQCKVSYNEVQSSDIGTPALANSVVSKLQSSPNTKYIYAIIGNVADGLASALTTAGITGVKIFGQVPDDASIAALRNGTNAWWVDQSSLMNGWTEMDGVLRAYESKSTVTDKGGYPLAVLTKSNVPSGTGIPVYPTDYQKEFETLWHVAG